MIDNGVGMDEETLAHIYDNHKVNYHSNGVGVYNVQKRLKLYYGEDYGITYESEKGEGTTATIRFRQTGGLEMKKRKKWLSICLVVCLIGELEAHAGIPGRLEERRLSLVYIPKVVDSTNDFWKALILGTKMAAKEYNADIEIKAPMKKMMWSGRMNF